MKKKLLNIARFYWGFPPKPGGVETHLTILLKLYVKEGIGKGANC